MRRRRSCEHASRSMDIVRHVGTISVVRMATPLTVSEDEVEEYRR